MIVHHQNLTKELTISQSVAAEVSEHESSHHQLDEGNQRKPVREKKEEGTHHNELTVL